ncbi:MAG TPA: hypothetical protein VGC67_17955 [Cellulomonas sp.]
MTVAGAVPLEFVDLVEVPFTVPGSRFVVQRGTGPHAGSLEVLHVRYEVPVAECLAVRLVPPGGGVAGAGPDAAQTAVRAMGGRLVADGLEIVVSGEELRVLTAAGSGWRAIGGPAPDVVPHRVPDSSRLVLTVTGATPATATDEAFRAGADAVVADWLALTPRVRPERAPMARQCWWVLGTNQIDLATPVRGAAARSAGPVRRAVVPSKRGYVALWQWDAYFIALGLRHTAPALAAEQLDIALTPGPDGQLPDVVHDTGVLASSADLPPADRARLLAAGAPTTGGEVPLTKPPLAAWAADRVLSTLPVDERAGWLRRWFPTVLRSQDWWFAASDPDGDGLPAYLHPYSSGLDDSPVFDHALPVTAPDLLAYLVVQDRILAGWCRELPDLCAHDHGLPARLLRRAARVRQGLTGLWDDDGRLFRPRAGTEPVPERTVVSLLGCFAGDATSEQLAGVLADVHDPARFGTPYPLPSVACDDTSFRREQMWRGPTWVNTGYLVAEGLERCGRPAAAAELRARILAGVEAAGGPVEYLDPGTGRRCPTATTSFGWSAALYLDLAVREEAGGQR